MVLGLKIEERDGKKVAQLHSEINYDKKVDLWAAGCILAEMLKGKMLFVGKDNADQWNQIIKALGTPNPDFISTLPDEIQDFVIKHQKHEPTPWEELFPDNLFRENEETEQYDTRTACAARNLLSNLLVIDPALRYSVDEALTLEYVQKGEQEAGEMRETCPVYVYNGYIEDLDYSAADWTKVIFFELKQYELMSLRNKDLNIRIQEECPKCIEHRCSCLVCNERNLETLLMPNQLGLSEKCDAIERE
uniref:Protein kinase domain-containing protein n=1 Tax=Acrobeloides nanus TaxID=290746 RepID=A0A914DRW7_9BILA